MNFRSIRVVFACSTCCAGVALLLGLSMAAKAADDMKLRQEYLRDHPEPTMTMANNLNLTATELDKYIGKSIEDICPLKYGTVGDEGNHCAHFVGHALTLNHKANVGLTCAGMTWEGRKKKDEGGCLRVNEVYNRVDHLQDADEKGCLICITMTSNVTKKGDDYTMGSQSRKHIGIYLGGHVWHYGNTKDKVKKQALGEFKKHYSGKTIILYSKFPKTAAFVSAS